MATDDHHLKIPYGNLCKVSNSCLSLAMLEKCVSPCMFVIA